MFACNSTCVFVYLLQVFIVELQFGKSHCLICKIHNSPLDYSIIKIRKAAGPNGVVSEMMKASGGFVTRSMTDLINNIVKEDCIQDDWRKSILVHVYKGKGDPLVCDSYRAIIGAANEGT